MVRFNTMSPEEGLEKTAKPSVMTNGVGATPRSIDHAAPELMQLRPRYLSEARLRRLEGCAADILTTLRDVQHNNAVALQAFIGNRQQ